MVNPATEPRKVYYAGERRGWSPGDGDEARRSGGRRGRRPRAREEGRGRSRRGRSRVPYSSSSHTHGDHELVPAEPVANGLPGGSSSEASNGAKRAGFPAFLWGWSGRRVGCARTRGGSEEMMARVGFCMGFAGARRPAASVPRALQPKQQPLSLKTLNDKLGPL